MKKFDDQLLAAVAEEDSGNGASRKDLYRTDIAVNKIEIWIFDAMSRDLIEVNENLDYELTAEGEARLEQLGG